MSVNLDENRTNLIAKIAKIVDQRLVPAEAKLVKDFLEQYYLGVAVDDLRDKNILDLYGALMSHWQFLLQRLPGECKIRVYNPTVEQDGWQCAHTVIEIILENKPFLLDTIRLALNKLDINIHLMIHAEGVRLERDKQGTVKEVLPLHYSNGHVSEAPIYIEVDRLSDPGTLSKIKDYLLHVLNDVNLMVRDWRPMLDKLQEAIAELETKANVEEELLFLNWLKDDHFTFIGYAEYEIVHNKKEGNLYKYVHNSGLGVLANNRIHNTVRNLDEMYPGAKKMILNDEVILMGKTDTIATVHRPVYTDFVAVKLFDDSGKVRKIVRFIGLYTATGYNEPADDIPLVRKKIDYIFENCGFARTSHDGKELNHIIETLPRDELLQARAKDIFDLSLGILHLQERQKIRLFIRRDIYGKYYSCMVFVPREIFNSELRMRMQNILLEELDGTTVSFDTRFSESVLARIHFMVRTESINKLEYDTQDIELLLVEAARSWGDDLRDALKDSFSEEKANELFKIYSDAFPAGYREYFYANAAVIDIGHIEHLLQQDENYLEMSLYHPLEEQDFVMRFKLFRKTKTIPLSDVVPILENMGLRIISERPYAIRLKNNSLIWINDYRLEHPKREHINLDLIKDIFQDAFSAAWHGVIDNDRFNKLVLSAALPWKSVCILRSYYRYQWQCGFGFSQSYVEEALYNNSGLAKLLIEYFFVKFNPGLKGIDRSQKLEQIKSEIENSLESVASLNEDRIIRHYLVAMEATVRTNYFQTTAHSEQKCYMSFKINSAKIPDLPLPKPRCEIFVFSTTMEGIHLRADMIARGGIRWSDRHEDYRTEVLGLMKAQQVKNAVIVPLGAKGGFVLKGDQNKLDVKKCYQIFIRGLLDITDNYQGDKIIRPEDCICYDEEDPYLVVAADKGTATFSDLANSVSEEYKFWLGDAFASGGSTGYDHKRMAITARGAWESVKMHFQYLGIDVQTQPIRVIGIGDMAGDVFGNGMLQSEQLKLVAAFNHVHIFIDPNPDPQLSFGERKRLFELPNSKWDDYNPELISTGGGVFSRSAKKINLSKEMQLMLNSNKETVTPTELLKLILTMQVDLLFNGGIGTFVKSSGERNTDVGDRSNDAIRINASELNARVVCEGGNLGFTQLARIEYAKKGGLINTDAIDNSGGVNCSDNEVNIKILLNQLVVAQEMTEKQRNNLLVEMTDQVARLVLANNINQNQAITLTVSQAAANLQMHTRLQKELELNAGLDPVVEFLPNAEEIAKRTGDKIGYTRPEIAILLAYTKTYLKKQIIASKLVDDEYVQKFLIEYFPQQLRSEKYAQYMQSHKLRKSIIATQISNMMVDEMGINFAHRLEEESGANIPDIVRAYMLVREIFNVPSLRAEIWSLPASIDANIKMSMLQSLNRMVRRSARWVLRNKPRDFNIKEKIELAKALIQDLSDNLEGSLRGAWKVGTEREYENLVQHQVPDALAKKVAMIYSMFGALEIIDAAKQNKFPVKQVVSVYFEIGAKLKLGWLGELINSQAVHNNWEALARSSFRDDVDKQQRNITVNILNSGLSVEQWVEKHAELIYRWQALISDLETSNPEFTMFAIALKELLNLTNAI